MANGNTEREKDPRKVIIFGLAQAGTEEELAKALKDVFGPVVGETEDEKKVVGVMIRKDREQHPYAFVEFTDEASAQMALTLSGKKFPELGDNEIKVELANKPLPRPEPQPKPVKGDVGPAGPQGPKGDVGPQGQAGPQGPAGPRGPAGANGADGAVGPAGPRGPAGQNAPKAAWILPILLALAAFVVVLGHAYCGSSTDQTARSAATEAAKKADAAKTAALEAQRAATAAQQTANDLPAQLAEAVKTGTDDLRTRLTTLEGMVAVQPEPTPAPEPAAPPAPAATAAPAQRMTGAVIVRNRLDQFEVRLDRIEGRDDRVEQRLDAVRGHFCEGAGPHDPERCAATE